MCLLAGGANRQFPFCSAAISRCLFGIRRLSLDEHSLLFFQALTLLLLAGGLIPDAEDDGVGDPQRGRLVEENQKKK